MERPRVEKMPFALSLYPLDRHMGLALLQKGRRHNTSTGASISNISNSNSSGSSAGSKPRATRPTPTLARPGPPASCPHSANGSLDGTLAARLETVLRTWNSGQLECDRGHSRSPTNGAGCCGAGCSSPSARTLQQIAGCCESLFEAFAGTETISRERGLLSQRSVEVSVLGSRTNRQPKLSPKL